MGISVLVAGDLAFREALAAALGSDYALIETDSATAAADVLLAARPAVAFVDLRGGSAAGSAVCRRIKGAASTRLLPVIAFAEPGEDHTVAALDDGADHVLPFPPPRAELHARIRSALRNRLATEGGQVLSGSPEDYAALIDSEEKRWGPLVKNLDLKVE